MFNLFRKCKHDWVEEPKQKMPEYYKVITCSRCEKKSYEITPKGKFLLKHRDFINYMYEVMLLHKLLRGKR